VLHDVPAYPRRPGAVSRQACLRRASDRPAGPKRRLFFRIKIGNRSFVVVHSCIVHKKREKSCAASSRNSAARRSGLGAHWVWEETRLGLRKLPSEIARASCLMPSVAARSAQTCAVVGSSGLLTQAKFGAEIDAHDLVMRFNDAPTAGFEDLVGGKTTMRIVNSVTMTAILEGCMVKHSEGREGRHRTLLRLKRARQKGETCALVTDALEGRPLSCCPREELVLNGLMASCFRKICPNSVGLLNVAPRELLEAYSLTDSKIRFLKSRSGILGVIAASQLCRYAQVVDLYGYSSTPVSSFNSSAIPYHYYDGCVSDDAVRNADQYIASYADTTLGQHTQQLTRLLRRFPHIHVRDPTNLSLLREPKRGRLPSAERCPDGRRRICGVRCPETQKKFDDPAAFLLWQVAPWLVLVGLASWLLLEGVVSAIRPPVPGPVSNMDASEPSLEPVPLEGGARRGRDTVARNPE
jgi:hypothetical protein